MFPLHRRSDPMIFSASGCFGVGPMLMHATSGYPKTNHGRFLRREISEKGSIARTWACLILAMPISWKSTLQQYVGPAFSLHDNKRFVQVCDYVDNYVLMLARMYDAKDMPRLPPRESTVAKP